MSDEKTVRSSRKLTTANSRTNATTFLVEETIKQMVNTAEVVTIGSADQNGSTGPGGYASATPLVCQVDTNNNTLAPAQLSSLPFFRPQAGKCAIIMDPQPGDKAIMVCMKRDSSTVATGKDDPSQPGSFRCFDQADGYLVNGFLGETPETWLHLDPPTGNIELSTKTATVTISVRESGDMTISTASGKITLSATEKIVLDAPVVETTGHYTQTGERNSEASTFLGGFTNTGGTITSNGVTVETHTHGGVESGSGNTGSPNAGT